MIGQRRILDEQEQDEFGPGSDLVLSMFAVSVLILAVVGVGSSLRDRVEPVPPDLTDELKKTRAERDDWKATADTYRREAEALRLRVEALLREADALRRDVEAQRLRADTEKRRADEAVAAVETLSAQVSKLIAELRARPGRESMVIRRADGREVVLAEDTVGSESFLPGQSELTPMGRARLRERMALVARWSETEEINVLLIEARETIDPIRYSFGRPGGDGALDLSAMRALTVAQTIATEYRVPFDCLSILARGRSRSEFLFRGDSVLPLPANTLGEYDRFFADGVKAGAQSSVPEVLRALEGRRRRDRVVTALAAYDPGVGSCNARILREALRRR